MAEYVDSATVRLALIPSAVDVIGGGIDAGTVRLKYTVTSADVGPYNDATTARLSFTVTTTRYDSATVFLTFTPSAVDQLVKLIPSFQVNALPRWAILSAQPKYVNLEVEMPKRWLISYVGKAPNVSGS
jgi:hypothetical protein